MTAQEHLIAGNRAAENALNTYGAAKVAKLYALAAYHMRRAKALGSPYANASQYHKYAAQYGKDAADECKRARDKVGASRWTRFAKAQRAAVKGTFRSTSRLSGHGPSGAILRKIPR